MSDPTVGSSPCGELVLSYAIGGHGFFTVQALQPGHIYGVQAYTINTVHTIEERRGSWRLQLRAYPAQELFPGLVARLHSLALQLFPETLLAQGKRGLAASISPCRS